MPTDRIIQCPLKRRYYADIIVNDLIILEIKAVEVLREEISEAETSNPCESAQSASSAFIRLDEYHILNPDNHANNITLSLSCFNTYGKEEADANFAEYFDFNRYTPQLCCGWDKA